MTYLPQGRRQFLPPFTLQIRTERGNLPFGGSGGIWKVKTKAKAPAAAQGSDGGAAAAGGSSLEPARGAIPPAGMGQRGKGSEPAAGAAGSL